MASNDFGTMAGAFLEYSLDCSAPSPSWVDFCAETSDISVSGGDRNIATQPIFCSGGTVTALGEKNPFVIDFTVLYSEAVGSPAWDAIWTAYQTLAASCDFGIRYTPLGNTTGNQRFTACGVLTNFPPPTGNADGSEIITTTGSMQAPAITVDLVP